VSIALSDEQALIPRRRASTSRRGRLALLAVALFLPAVVTVHRLGAATIVERRTAASADDAEEFSTGVMYIQSSDLELIHDNTDQTVGMRWTGLMIPQGASITAAYIQFASKESQSEATTLSFRGQAADNPVAFDSTAFNISTRPRTTASMAWSPLPWNTGEVGPNQRTPDLSAVIQEVVNRPGWLSGNALVIVVTGSGHRTAYSWDGTPTGAPLLHIEYVTGPTSDAPPVARLGVTQLSSPALTVDADGSMSTDTDATPIASYRFDFGDGTAAVTTMAPTANAQHTYAAAGTYTVTLTVTDTGGLTSTPARYTITVTGSDSPPVARLTVTQLSSPALTVNADGSASTDADATPIASYRFTFGDGTAAVTTTAPTASAQHTYASAGTYTVTLTATDTGGLTSAPATATITVTQSTGARVAVYAGYYDTHHSSYLKPKPNPWKGSSNVTFVGKPDGSSGGWDTSALRIDNLSGQTLSGVVVKVDIGSNHFALWGTNSIPAGYSLILAQTSIENFDGSDTNPAGCYGCSSKDCINKVMSTIPVVHVTIGGSTTDYVDPGQILNTHGVDAAGCPYTGTRNDESQSWQQIYPRQSAPAQATAGSAWSSAWQPPAWESLWLGPPIPNPVRDVAAVRFATPAVGPVRLSVYDVTGRLVRVCVDELLDAGDYDVRVDLAAAHPGVYFLSLWTPEGIRHRTLTLAR